MIIIAFSEHVSIAIKREFIEEAMNSNVDGAKLIDELFKTGVSVINFIFKEKSFFLILFVKDFQRLY